MTLREVLLRRGVEVHATSKPNEIRICCPFCIERGETVDERHRLNVNIANGKGYCFNCRWNSHSKAPQAILAKLRLGELRLDYEPVEEVAQEKWIPKLPEDFQLLSKASNELDRMARRYLRKRGITPEQIERNKIGTSFIGRYAYRVVFPVRFEKRLHGLVCRDITGRQEPKYLNSPGIKSLYNLEGGAKTLVLSEGVFKALRIERMFEKAGAATFRSSAILGRAITEEQILQIRKVDYQDVVIWPDPDKSGREGAADVAKVLTQAGFRVGVVWPVSVPADEDDRLERTWESVELYSRSLYFKLRLARY